MNYVEFAREVHELAVAKGWWTNDDIDEKVSMVHCEWSEALQEYRNGHPMVWYQCLSQEPGNGCSGRCAGVCTDAYSDKCVYRGDKPEGIAVELVDGVLRLFDLAAFYMQGMNPNDFEGTEDHADDTLFELVNRLHKSTVHMLYNMDAVGCFAWDMARIIKAWMSKRCIDFDALLLEKHAYNKTRAYRHGGKLC